MQHSATNRENRILTMFGPGATLDGTRPQFNLRRHEGPLAGRSWGGVILGMFLLDMRTQFDRWADDGGAAC